MSGRILTLTNTDARLLAGRRWRVAGRTYVFKPIDPKEPGSPPWKSGMEGKAYPLLDAAGRPAAYIKFFSTDSAKRFERARWLIAQQLPAWSPHLVAAPSLWLDSREAGVGRPDGVTFDLTGCVAELAPGETWLEVKLGLTENARTIPPELRWRLATDLIFALAVLERAGLIHGDLSPNNLLIHLTAPADQPAVRVIDFDAFAAPAEAGYLALTIAEGGTYGTPGYCPLDLVAKAAAGNQQLMPYSDRRARDMLLLEFLFAEAGHDDRPPGEWDAQDLASRYSVMQRRCSAPHAEVLQHLNPAQVFTLPEPKRTPSQKLAETLGLEVPRPVLKTVSRVLPPPPKPAPARAAAPSAPAPQPAPRAAAVPAPAPPLPSPPATAGPRAGTNQWGARAVLLGVVGLVSALATPGNPQVQQAMVTYLALGCGVGGLICAALGIRQGSGKAWLALLLAISAVGMGGSTYQKTVTYAAAVRAATEASARAQVEVEAQARQRRLAEEAAQRGAKAKAEMAAKAEAVALRLAEANAKAEIQKIAAATKDSPWANSLGMKFVPVAGTPVLFSVWDTRVQDYAAFASATRQSWTKPDFAQEPTHSAVNVSWNEAQAFAKWLTEKERREGKIPNVASYRLPQDWEWSLAVGLDEARAGTPKDKDGKIENEYPWGTQWPPLRGAGNYYKSLNVDDYEYTSPVGSFAANRFGLYDMGGNVWQWCEDFYDGSSSARVLRGGSWSGGGSDGLLSSCRIRSTVDSRNDNIGFRCVLVGVSSR